MADFSDQEDRALVVLARQALQDKSEFSWQKIHLLLAHTGKSKETLRRRLHTLRRTYGKDLSKFPRWFFIGSSFSTPTVLPTTTVYGILEEVFSDVDKAQLHQKSGKTHLNAGEIGAAGVSTFLKALGRISPNDVFLDIGAGIGNVVIQVALQTCVRFSYGIEIRTDVVEISRNLVRKFCKKYHQLSKVWQSAECISKLSSFTMAKLQKSTIIYTSCELFEPEAKLKLEESFAR